MIFNLIDYKPGMTAKDLMEACQAYARQKKEQGQVVRSEVPVETDGTEATVYLYDMIVSDRLMAEWLGGVDPLSFAEAFGGIEAETIHLRINSPGGDVFAARTIQTAIKQHAAKVVAHIDGLAASAATYIALAADEVEIAEGGFFMVHNAWTCMCGNKNDMIETAEFLEQIDESIANDYRKKTGASPEQIREWMDKETWFSAQDALEAGFVDRVFDADDNNGSADDPDASAAADVEHIRAMNERRLTLVGRLG